MKTLIPVTYQAPKTTRFPILIKGAKARLGTNWREVCEEMKIHWKGKGRDVIITQVAEIGVSFNFLNHSHEFHLPARLVRQAFYE
jgi:hypothetical protein